MGDSRLRGRYEILDTLGGRPPAATHLALDHQTGLRCVLKVVAMAQPGALAAHERLVHEASLLRRLDHPAIPRLLESWSDEAPEPRAVLARQHVEGATLSSLVQGGRRFGERDALRIAAKLAGILEYLHGLSPAVLHRGLEPANVVLGEHDRVWLVDLGAARDELAPRLLHASGLVTIGTRGYAAPECEDGSALPASDLYSLGATLFFLLAGSSPTTGRVGAEAARLAARLGISTGTAQLLQRLLDPDWHRRPASAGALKLEIEELVAAVPPQPAAARAGNADAAADLPASPAAPEPRPQSRRSRTRLVIAAGLALAAVLGVVAWLASQGRGELHVARPRARVAEPLGGGRPESPGASLPETSGRAPSGAQAPLAEALPWAATTPTPMPARPTPQPQPPAEATPLPRQGVPEGFDVSAAVQLEEGRGFTVHRFTGELAHAQPLDVELGLSSVWVGTSLGLLRHDLRSGAWKVWDERSGLPGARVDEIAVVGVKVVADTARPTRPGSVAATGVFAFDSASRTWAPFPVRGGVWDLRGDSAGLGLGLRDGAEWRDAEKGTTRRFKAAAGQLVHDAVHSVRRHRETIGFASLGDFVEATRDFDGGGVALWERATDRFQLFGVRDGLAHGYSCDLFLDEDEVWVAHWNEERGLSRLDRRTGQWEVVRSSANGVDLGGVVLAGDPETLWIGQQGALVTLDRRTRQATVIREKDGLPGHIVSGLAVDDDAVWASVYAYGREGVRTAGLVRLPRAGR